jgi:hypothetical protein
MGLSTVIGKSNRDASGNKIEPSVLSTMNLKQRNVELLLVGWGIVD